MFADLPQLVPQKICLSCQGCGRFKDARSVWRPKVAPGELEDNEHKNEDIRDGGIEIRGHLPGEDRFAVAAVSHTPLPPLLRILSMDA